MTWRTVPADPLLLCVALGSLSAVLFLFMWFLMRPRR